MTKRDLPTIFLALFAFCVNFANGQTLSFERIYAEAVWDYKHDMPKDPSIIESDKFIVEITGDTIHFEEHLQYNIFGFELPARNFIIKSAFFANNESSTGGCINYEIETESKNNLIQIYMYPGYIGIFLPIFPNQKLNKFCMPKSAHNISVWNKLVEMVNRSALQVDAPMAITTDDLLHKVLGIRTCDHSIWEVDYDYVWKERSKAHWGSDGPSQPVTYLGRKIKSMHSPLAAHPSREVACYRYWFTFNNKSDRNKFRDDVLADFKRNGTELRKLNTAKSSLKNVWGVVVGDTFVSVYIADGVLWPSCTIEMWRVGSEEHLWWRQRNPFL